MKLNQEIQKANDTLEFQTTFQSTNGGVNFSVENFVWKSSSEMLVSHSKTNLEREI